MVIRNRVNKYQGGWTLIEVSLTFALIGALAALAIPAFAQIGDRLDREMFLGVLASDLRMAQRIAMMRETETEIQFHKQGSRYSVIQGKHIISRENVPSRYRLKTNYPGDRLQFRRTGQVRGGTFRLMKGDQLAGKVIIQVGSGRVRVEVEP